MTDSHLLEKVDTFVRSRLSDKRYAHTLRVANTAEHLAKRHGLHAKQVRLAALLHDAAREMDRSEFLETAEEWNLPISDFERLNPKLLHGPVAAEMAKRELGIEDDEVLTAIRVHTAGEPGMSALSLVVYVADKIEPARDYPSVESLRELADRDIQEAATEALRRAISYNELRGKRTHPASIETLGWLEELAERRI